MNEFQGKVALVTGGTSGIGRAAAIAYDQVMDINVKGVWLSMKYRTEEIP